MENNTNNNSLTRLELSDALVREVGLSRHESMQLVDDVLDHLSNSLALGENVKISSFGTFSCRQKKERIGRNPKTGIEAPIIARKVVTFKPSQIMKNLILTVLKINNWDQLSDLKCKKYKCYQWESAKKYHQNHGNSSENTGLAL